MPKESTKPKVPEGFEKYCSGETIEIAGSTFFVLDTKKRRKPSKTAAAKATNEKKALTPV